METAIGLFFSREHCQDAMCKVLEEQVPRHSSGHNIAAMEALLYADLT